MVQKASLGKGLASLLGSSAAAQTSQPVEQNPRQSKAGKPLPSGQKRFQVDKGAFDKPESAEAKAELPSREVGSTLKGGLVDNNNQQSAAFAGRSERGTEVQEKARSLKEQSHRILGMTHLSVEHIKLNTYQPRKEFDPDALSDLADSVRVSGVIQPLIVRKLVDGSFELIAGERRLRAAKLVGLKEVPVVFRTSTDKEALEVALVENVQRQDLNPVDEALAYLQLTDEFGLGPVQIGERVGKNEKTIINALRLLQLPPTILQDLRDAIISVGHAKVILSLDTVDARIELRNACVDQGLSVREAEVLARKMKAQPGGKGTSEDVVKNEVTERLYAVAQQLTQFLGVKVELRGDEQKGKLVLHYLGKQDLDRILDAIR
jgi:ParB family chromosome partitioning protein